MPLNKPALEALNQTNFPDNQQQLITPVLLREFNDEMINSMELTQSMDNYANLGTANLFYGGNQSIAKEYKLFTNGVYWNNNTAGYNNLEIINSITGNIDIAALGGGVRIVSSSLNIMNGTFTASLAEGYTYVGNSSGRTTLVATSSFGTPIPAGTISSSAQITNLGFVSSSVTASSLVTASFSGNTLTFTKGDASTFGVVIPDVSGSTLPSGLLSSSVTNFTDYSASVDSRINNITGSSINTGSFATTGSNTFNGSQTISGSVAVKNILSFPNGLAFSGNAGDVSQISAATTIQLITEMPAGPGGTNDIKFINRVTGSSVSFINEREGAGNNVYFEAGEIIFNAGIRSGSNGNITFRNTINSIDASSTPITASAFKAGAGGINSVGALTASLQQGYAWVGDSSGVSTLVATSSFGGTIPDGRFATLGANTFTGSQTISNAALTVSSTGSLFFNLNATTQNNILFNSPTTQFTSYGAFIFNNNGSAGGSGSVQFTAASQSINFYARDGIILGRAETAPVGNGFVRMNTTSGSLVLTPSGFSNNAVDLLHLSGSSNSNNVNLMFKNNSNAIDTTISGSNNIFTNPTSTSAGFKRYLGGSNNIILNGANMPFLSGSMGFSPTFSNNYIGGNLMAFRGPVSSSAWNINNNILNTTGQFLIGSSVTTNAQQIVSGLSLSNNVGSGFMQMQAYKTPLSSSVNYSTNTATGIVAINLHSSSINMTGNISLGGTTINNSYFPLSSSITQANGTVVAQTNIFLGSTNINFSGSNAFVAPSSGQRVMNNNIMAGYNSASLVLNGDSANMFATAMFGAGLSVTGSNTVPITAAIPSDFGSVFVGRNNAQNGNRARTAETVFAVGTGTSGSAKTGFLIDSGSNTYVEGSLNVSGSTSLTGSLTLNGNTITAVNTASLATTGSNSFVGTQIITGSLIVSGSGAQVRLPSFDTTTGRIKESLSFTGSRFATDLSMSIEMENLNGTEFGFNQLDSSDGNTGAQFILNTNKDSTFTELKLNARYTGSSNAEIRIRNTAGVRTATIDADTSTFNGNVKVASTFQLQLPTGSNQQAGTAVLDGANPGTVTVSNSLVTANSIIMLTKQTLAHPNGYVAVSSKGAGTFTITSNHNGDTDTVGWFIINNS